MAQSAGSRPRSKTPRGVLQVDWAFFGELCRVLALKVFREYDPEVVIGIAKAGVIPGAVVASILQRDFASIARDMKLSERMVRYHVANALAHCRERRDRAETPQ